jgi:outer membrane protein OmpA-like peptidoglycan-associated protein
VEGEPTAVSHEKRPRRLATRDPRKVQHWFGVVGAVVLVVGVFTLVMNPAGSTNSHNTTKATAPFHVSTTLDLAMGKAEPAEPSGEAPMPANALPGYTQTYVNDFTGTTLPPGWDVFTGTASGDTGSQFGAAHVTVSNGLLSLNTWQDPSYGNQWVTGGLCQCGAPLTYGASFVRSRVTGPGPTIVELLWPLAGWPPEIDFTETDGTTMGTAATVIWAQNGGQDQIHLNVDMTQWHTWGVIWTPTSLLYTVDGKVWGQFNIAADIPHQSMTLNLQQQTWCTYNYACPTLPQSAQIDWVAEFSPIANYTTTLGPFSARSSALNGTLKTEILELAASIDAQGAESVALTGYSDSKTKAKDAKAVGENRASSVKSYLLSALASLDYSGVTVTTTAGNEKNPASFTNTSTGRARNARVTVRLFQKPSP